MKNISRKTLVAVLIIIMVAMGLISCGSKEAANKDDPSETAVGTEAGEKTDAEAEEEPEVNEEAEANEEPEVIEHHVAWVVEPTGEYQDIDRFSSRNPKFEGRENSRIRRTCYCNNIGYPQQWGEGIIPDSEGGGTISYSPNAIAVAKEDGYMKWGIVDYDGNVLLEPSLSPNFAGLSPFRTPGYVNLYGGIGYYSDHSDIFNILSADYSEIAYSFSDAGGYGVPEIEYCIEDGKLYHLDSGYPTLEFSESEMVDILKDTLVPVVRVSEMDGKIDKTGGAYYNLGGYAYVDKNGNIVPQNGYYSGSFVNGFYVGYTDRKAYENSWEDDVNNKCTIIDALSGEPITGFIYEKALYFEEGYCPVKRDGKWGFIDERGEEVTDMLFDKVSTVYDGKIAAIVDGKFSIINLKESIEGGKLTKEIFDEAFAPYMTAAAEEETESAGSTESSMKFPEDFVGTYGFTSGVGGWGTSIELHEDGTFDGGFHDSNMGESGDDYPYGTVYYCNFSGRFELVKEDAYNTYSVELKDLQLENEVGEEEIEEGVKYVASDPYGLGHGTTFIFMGEQADGRNLSENVKVWLTMPLWMTQEEIESEQGLPRSILINVETEETFARASN